MVLIILSSDATGSIGKDLPVHNGVQESSSVSEPEGTSTTPATEVLFDGNQPEVSCPESKDSTLLECKTSSDLEAQARG